MPEIFITPGAKAGQSSFNLLRWIFRGRKTVDKQSSCPARQARLKVQNALIQQTFDETPSLKLNNTAKPISEVLEDISQNILKMDQNLYAAKANMEEILHANANDNELVSLD